MIHALLVSTYGRLSYDKQASAKLMQCFKPIEAQQVFGDMLEEDHVDYIWKYMRVTCLDATSE